VTTRTLLSKNILETQLKLQQYCEASLKTRDFIFLIDNIGLKSCYFTSLLKLEVSGFQDFFKNKISRYIF